MAKNNKAVDSTETETPVIDPLAQLKADLEAAKLKLKEAKDAAKGTKQPKDKKGVMVSFTNKAKEEITGLGNLYYVVRQGGKLHYKEASQVKVLTAEEIAALPKAD